MDVLDFRMFSLIVVTVQLRMRSGRTLIYTDLSVLCSTVVAATVRLSMYARARTIEELSRSIMIIFQ